MATIFDNPLTGYRFVDTQFGDTLQKIAFRELADATQWPLLIAYNKLVWPYITDDPDQATDGVILSGSQILVPAPVPVIESTTDPSLVFEIDIALDANGFLQADSTGDIAIVSGVANFQQAISNRVSTDCGELLFHGDYGTYVRQLIGAMNGPNVALLAGKYVESSVIADDRVLSVVSTDVSTSFDSTQVVMEINPIIGRPVQLTVQL